MTKTGTQQIEGTTEQTTLRDNSITANENRTKDEGRQHGNIKPRHWRRDETV